MSFDILLKVAKRINELAQAERCRRLRDHPRHRHDGGVGILPEPDGEDRQAGRDGRLDASSTAVSADGPLNLYNAVGVAVDPKAKGRGVLVVMNDWIHGAHSLTKTSTTAVQTFMSPVRGLVGVASYGKNDFYNDSRLEAHDADRIRHLQRHPAAARGHCIRGVDMSPRPDRLLGGERRQGHRHRRRRQRQHEQGSVDAAANAVKKGVVVVRSSRVPTGSVGRNVELDDDKLGFIASDELNPQKSRILLSLALLKKRTPDELQQLFNTY